MDRRPLFLSAYSIDAKHACRDGHRYRPAAEEEGGSFFRCLRANVAAVTGGRTKERWKWSWGRIVEGCSLEDELCVELAEESRR